jgi:hypothetical protein
MPHNRPGYTHTNCQDCGKPSGGRSRCPACMAAITTANRIRRERYRAAGRCPVCGVTTPHKVCPTCFATQQAYKQSIRLSCITAYGGACACCGESRQEFLQMAHTAGDGAIERAAAKQQGLPQTIYARLKKQGYPPGFRVLCANCNSSLAFYGYCPHNPSSVLPVRGRLPSTPDNPDLSDA